MNIGGLGCRCWLPTVAAAGAQELQASLNVWVAGVEFSGALIRIQGIRDLVVA
jgi:hypothetical protein